MCLPSYRAQRWVRNCATPAKVKMNILILTGLYTAMAGSSDMAVHFLAERTAMYNVHIAFASFITGKWTR